jgi:uncharacterized protein YegP (UPF0339 family)
MAKRADRVTYTKGSDGKWYLHLKSGNGKVIADGAEGYVNKASAKRAAEALAKRLNEPAEVPVTVVAGDE